MKKRIYQLAALALLSMLSLGVNAQVTESTDAAAMLITPLSITETSSLQFGSMAVSATDGTCVLSTASSRTATGGVNLSSVGNTAASAAYTVAGNASATYAVTLPATINVSDGSTVLNITALKALLTNTATDQAQGSITGTLSTGGSDGISVGGTLTIPGGTTAGEYTGSFNITIAYN